MEIAGTGIFAVLLGALLATRMPVLPFAIALMLVDLAGLAGAVGRGVPLLRAMIWALALFALMQIGYVVGLARAARVEERARSGPDQDKLAGSSRRTLFRAGGN